jgi:hypothetical protein
MYIDHQYVLYITGLNKKSDRADSIWTLYILISAWVINSK